MTASIHSIGDMFIIDLHWYSPAQAANVFTCGLNYYAEAQETRKLCSDTTCSTA